MLIGVSQEILRGALLLELKRQEETKRNFSFRRLGKQCGISHSLLSLLVTGKRPITEKSWQKLVNALPALALSEGKAEALPQFEKLSTNDFARISDWYHYAILSLLETKGFRLDYQWISERLGITPIQSQSAISELKAMGIIAKKGDGWKQVRGPLKIENTKPLTSSRSQQHQLLEKALQSLEQDAFEIRDFSSMTLAMDPSLIPYAREKIREFRRTLVNKLEKKGNATEVYHLTVQIYPVSKPVIERKTNP